MHAETDCSFSVTFAASFSSSSPLNTAGLSAQASASRLFPPGDPTNPMDSQAVCAWPILTFALWPQLPQRLLGISPRMPKRSIQTECMDPPDSRHSPTPAPSPRGGLQLSEQALTSPRGPKCRDSSSFFSTSTPCPVQILSTTPSRSASDQVPAPPPHSSPGPWLPQLTPNLARGGGILYPEVSDPLNASKVPMLSTLQRLLPPSWGTFPTSAAGDVRPEGCGPGSS